MTEQTWEQLHDSLARQLATQEKATEEAVNNALAFERALDRERAENERLRQGLDEAERQIRLLAEAGVARLADYGVKVDPAERTYKPIIDRIRAIAKGLE